MLWTLPVCLSWVTSKHASVVRFNAKNGVKVHVIHVTDWRDKNNIQYGRWCTTTHFPITVSILQIQIHEMNVFPLIRGQLYLKTNIFDFRKWIPFKKYFEKNETFKLTLGWHSPSGRSAPPPHRFGSRWTTHSMVPSPHSHSEVGTRKPHTPRRNTTDTHTRFTHSILLGSWFGSTRKHATVQQRTQNKSRKDFKNISQVKQIPMLSLILIKSFFS